MVHVIGKGLAAQVGAVLRGTGGAAVTGLHSLQESQRRIVGVVSLGENAFSEIDLLLGPFGIDGNRGGLVEINDKVAGRLLDRKSVV